MFKKVLLSFVVFLIGVLVGGGGVYYGAKLYPSFFGFRPSQDQVQSEVDTLLGEIGAFMSLPSDEKPTVATVTDVEKIKSQSFFRNAQNGDRVIIYSEAKKAILYRQAQKKIIEVGTISINNQPQTTGSPASQVIASPQATPIPTPTPAPAVVSSPTPTQSINPVPEGGN
jgi:hypothetical protein